MIPDYPSDVMDGCTRDFRPQFVDRKPCPVPIVKKSSDAATRKDGPWLAMRQFILCGRVSLGVGNPIRLESEHLDSLARSA